MFLSVLFLFIFNSFHFFCFNFRFSKKMPLNLHSTPWSSCCNINGDDADHVHSRCGFYGIFSGFTFGAVCIFLLVSFFSAVGNTIDYTPFIKTSMMNFSMWKSNEIFRRVRQPAFEDLFPFVFIVLYQISVYDALQMNSGDLWVF